MAVVQKYDKCQKIWKHLRNCQILRIYFYTTKPVLDKSITNNRQSSAFKCLLVITLQTHHVNSTQKRRGNGHFYVVSTWNPRGVFAGEGVRLVNIVINRKSSPKVFCKKSVLKGLRNYNGKLFLCPPQKQPETHNQHFKLLFFKINLQFGTSD